MEEQNPLTWRTNSVTGVMTLQCEDPRLNDYTFAVREIQHGKGQARIWNYQDATNHVVIVNSLMEAVVYVLEVIKILRNGESSRIQAQKIHALYIASSAGI